MKTFATRFFITGALVALTAAAASAQAPSSAQQETIAIYNSVGPVLDGSVSPKELPAPALAFIEENFPNADIATCTRDYSDGEFDVDLTDGTDLEFDHQGNWIEVEAGQMRRLSAMLVKKLIPANAYKELERRKMTTEVESVKRSKDGFKVELREVKYADYRFSSDGRLLSNR